MPIEIMEQKRGRLKITRNRTQGKKSNGEKAHIQKSKKRSGEKLLEPTPEVRMEESSGNSPTV